MSTRRDIPVRARVPVHGTAGLYSEPTLVRGSEHGAQNQTAAADCGRSTPSEAGRPFPNNLEGLVSSHDAHAAALLLRLLLLVLLALLLLALLPPLPPTPYAPDSTRYL